MSKPFAIRLAENAVREFFTRWSAGLQPCLLLETHANGEILVSSRVSAPPPHRHQTEQEDDQLSRQGHRHHHRPPGPARLRRRARRAHARAAAANAATTDAAAVKAVASQDAAVQAVVMPPQSSDAAVQVVINTDQEKTAVQAARAPHQHHQPLPLHAGQASHRQHPLSLSYKDVQDMLCPDRDYHGLVRKEDEEKRKNERQKDLEEFNKMIENSFKF